MAIRNKSNTTVDGVVPPNVQREVFTLRIKKADWNVKGERPRIDLDCEILSPEFLVIEGQKYLLDNVPVRYMLFFKDKSGNDIVGYITQVLNPKLGLPEEIDDENPNTSQYEGIVFQAMLSSLEDKPQFKNPETGKWEVRIDPETKEPISLGWKWFTDIKQIIGLAEAPGAVNKPY